tara:strand:+ start:17438 stop:18214 length:777 start_codon:yes stop_codon:yes gene_type:complete
MKFYLDFDGVIAHSAIECINSAFVVWLNKNNILYKNIDNTDKLTLKSKIIDCSITNRYLVIPPENYYCLIDAAFHEIAFGNNNPTSKNIRDSFKAKLNSICKEELNEFKHNFFSYRDKKFDSQSDSDWVLENPPTTFISAFYKLINDYDVQISVVSRKNYKAIEKWFKGANLGVDNIYGNEALSVFKNNKFLLIEDIQRNSGNQKGIFVDDFVSEFDSLGWEDINIITLPAGWGYNNLKDNTKQTLNIIKEQMNDLSN